MLERNDATLHLWQTADEQLGRNSACRFDVDDVAGLFEAVSAVVSPRVKLTERPWGVVEFAVSDPAGALVWFVEHGSGARD